MGKGEADTIRIAVALGVYAGEVHSAEPPKGSMDRLNTILHIILSLFPNIIKIPLYRILLGADIGRGVKIGFGTVLDSSRIVIGDYSRIGKCCHLKCDQFILHRYCVIGDRTRVTVCSFIAASRSVIDRDNEIIGDYKDKVSAFEIGMHSWILPYCFIDVTREMHIGRNVGVGGRSLIFTHGYWLPEIDGYPVTYATVTIGDDVWIPWECFVMPGTSIGSGVIVGARSLVKGNVPDGAFIAGSPARIVRQQAPRMISHEERLSLLIRDIEDFYYSRCEKHMRCDSESAISYSGSAGTEFVIHKFQSDTKASCYARHALNIVFFSCQLDVLADYPVLSLADYRSSTYTMIPEKARDWLQFSRRSGLRFYPHDEIEQWSRRKEIDGVFFG